MSLEITVDHDRCVGSTMCVLTADAVFALNEDGQSVVVNPDGAGTARIVDAASQCPMEAITVVAEDGGETLFP